MSIHKSRDEKLLRNVRKNPRGDYMFPFPLKPVEYIHFSKIWWSMLFHSHWSSYDSNTIVQFDYLVLLFWRAIFPLLIVRKIPSRSNDSLLISNISLNFSILSIFFLTIQILIIIYITAVEQTVWTKINDNTLPSCGKRLNECD